ncbi:MAG: GNAT family N-acetyltransferase [Bryobacter sp.]|nr:GNAT family N-acetyltransferase [Bryobacter sp.]
MVEIRRLAAAELLERKPEFQALLQDAVESGGTVGFVLPIELDKAERYWSGVAREMECGERELLAAFADGQIVGSLQIAYEKAESVKHRADLQKLMVLSPHRRQGIARLLLIDAVLRMPALGLLMYTITTRCPSPAEDLVHSLRFTRYGVLPHYGVTPAGELHDASLHYISKAIVEAIIQAHAP